MTKNVYTRLKQLLPPSPVLVGRVTAIHEDDDTSTIELPTNQGLSNVAQNVFVGSTIRARGTFVPVGQKAFVRDGVIETRAPDEDILDIPVGRVVSANDPLVFNGPIEHQLLHLSAAASFGGAAYWEGGKRPYAFSVQSGTLPAGLTLNTTTGFVSGSPSSIGFSTFVLRVTDSLGATADSNEIVCVVHAGVAAVSVATDSPSDSQISLDEGDTWFPFPYLPSGWPWNSIARTPVGFVAAAGGWILSLDGGDGTGDIGGGGSVVAPPGYSLYFKGALAFSTNLIDWEVLFTSTGGEGDPVECFYVLATNGMNVVAGNNTSGAAAPMCRYSLDGGRTWAAGAGSNYIQDVVWSPEWGKFVSVGSQVSSSSPDGAIWTGTTGAVLNASAWLSVCYTGAVFLAGPSVNLDGNLARATNPTVWHPVNVMGPGVLTTTYVASDGNGVALFNQPVAGVGSDLLPGVRRSADHGVTWPPAFAVTTDPDAFMRSDTLKWTGSRFMVFLRSGDPFVAAESDKNVVLTSPDGLTWTEVHDFGNSNAARQQSSLAAFLI